MPFEDELRAAVASRFGDIWNVKDGITVPNEGSITLGNSGIEIEATVLYADLSDSTELVDLYDQTFAAEVYGTFLHCSSRIIKANGGTITAFDGDRVMAVYMGPQKEANACWTGLKINRAMIEVIRPALHQQYPNIQYLPRHTVGIDNSQILVVKEGIRGDNDLVWVGRAANYAAKLCTLDHSYQTRITQPVRNAISGGLLTTVVNTPVWEQVSWTAMSNLQIYRSSCLATGM